MTTAIRVLLVDDHALVRSGFAMVLSVEDDIEVVGQAADGRAALAVLAEHPADVVLMDVQMPVLDGIAATREIVAAGLAKVIILTTFDRDDYLFDGLAAGASGFLLKNADPSDLVEAVRAVADGHALLAPEATLKVIARLTQASPGASQDLVAASPATPAIARAVAPRLTPRELEVLELLADGLSNAEIAARLFLGEATVKTHVSNILAKTASRDRVQAVIYAYRNGLHPRG
ncbi:two component transcriptional regulator, LuxR family [Sanguibacter gelidistatuariae]|uniref:Two component transcriptional regulator, LuxR family n=1 Tax=Sanguibacter gelidistatuariae TaxID=1814289 RepID=A0A1G6KLE8_9MICO|nr:response regulator transcription factor [Sanguibacter gelidistatuariae]SDC31783.1 two component transcriptional regulator, LuxR family [Sanguibacter gelidistatuariae]